MDKYKITFETWNKNATLYEEKFMHLNLYDESYIKFCELLPKDNPAIFEIGCGPGNITKYLIAKRPDFKIMAIDISPNMIQLAKINNPNVDFSVMDCREVNTIKQKFDGIICGFCIPYLSKEDCTKLFKDCFHLLNKDGIFYFSTIGGNYNDSGFEAASTGDLSYVYYYSKEYFENELKTYGFQLIDFMQINFPKSVGTNQINQIYIAKK